jgi:hypothetical protein
MSEPNAWHDLMVAAGGKPLDFLFDDSASGLFLDQLAIQKRVTTQDRLKATAHRVLWSPTIRAAVIAGTPWLDVYCPGCGTSRAPPAGVCGHAGARTGPKSPVYLPRSIVGPYYRLAHGLHPAARLAVCRVSAHNAAAACRQASRSTSTPATMAPPCSVTPA